MICFAFIPITYLFYPETANRYILNHLGGNSRLDSYANAIDRTLEDIDRFFETKPGLLVYRIPLAVQLERPVEFIEADERIAKEQLGVQEKEGDSITLGIEHVEGYKV